MKKGKFPIEEFKKVQENNPYWSSFLCFAKVIEGKKNLSRKTIQKYFYKLVDKEDYSKSERFEILNNLYEIAGCKRGS